MPSSAFRFPRARRFFSVACALVGWTALAWGQVAPEGVHHPTVGPGTGVAGNGSPTGGFAASVPLELPDPRGPLPVPVSIVYTGSARAGAAGAGWDVPVSYVRRQVSTWRRRPMYLDVDGTGQAAERIQLAMHGASQLMVPRGGAYVPHVGSEYVELTPSGDGWRAKTLDNLEYVFSPANTVVAPGWDPDLWLLTEIRDLVGTDSVVLRYTTWGDLAGVAHTFSAAKIPLYEIELVHEPFGTAPFETVREDATAFQRSRVLARVDVKARNNHAPSVSPKVIRSYHLTYGSDPDTAKPRLREVTVTGEEGVPGSTAALPVATYSYGSVSADPESRIEFGPGDPVARNLGSTTYGANLATTTVKSEVIGIIAPPGLGPIAARVEDSRARHLLRDFTGDGLPDLVYKDGSEWKLVANRLDAAGEPHLDGPTTSWREPAELHWETTLRYDQTTAENQPFARAAMITSDTWTTFVDWNGDGRLDIVDTRGGQTASHWKLWLNQPGANGTITWQPHQIDVALIRKYLEGKGFEIEPTGFLAVVDWPSQIPLSRSRSWPRVNTWACHGWQCDGGQCDPVDCSTPPWGVADEQVDTMTEWVLADKNGDSYPDFIALDMPVRECEERPVIVQSSPPIPAWDGHDCNSHDPPRSPLEMFGSGVVDGFYSCSKANHEWITSQTSINDPDPCGLGPYADAGAATFLNRYGPFVGVADSPFAATPVLESHFPAGLEQWTTGSNNVQNQPGPAAGVSWQAAGLFDRFAHGELDLRRRQTINADVDTAIFKTNRHEKCAPEDPHPVQFSSWQKAGEADVNGDGLADHIYAEEIGPTATRRWYVRFNTGVGWGPEREIRSPDSFAVSEAQGVCTTGAQSSAGLTDLDGDGIPELLRVSNGVLYRAKLITNPLEVGRLTRIQNGYGATTYVRYANAKADTLTQHAVAFPEVVVAESGTHVTGSGVGVAPVFYAYGNASVTYEPLAGQWSFSGYRRVVAMTGLLDDDRGLIEGIAVVTDRGDPAAAGSTWDEHASAQQVNRTRYVEGSFSPNTIGSLLVGDPPPFAETTASFGSRQLAFSSSGIPDLDCADLHPALAIPAGTERCGTGGIVFAQQTQAWEGVAAPPSISNTLAGSTTDEVDAYGRPTRMTNAGDLRRSDDDVCTVLTYASPPGGGVFPSVPSAMAITDCGLGNPAGAGPGTPVLLSVVRFFYDQQPHGVVQVGRLTSRQVDRYGPSGYLDTHTVDRTTYDTLGEIATVTTDRAQGTAATHVVQITRDAFGATVTSTTEQASDVSQTFTGSLMLSSWPTIPSRAIDHTGISTFSQHDRFGRKVLSWVDPGGHKSVLSRTIYDDNPAGRRVTVETFPGDTLPGTEDSTTDKQRATVEIDSLGRPRFTLTDLGSDYGGMRIVSDLAEYDALGRATFVAAPFATDEDPFVPDPLAEPFGTSAVYDRRNRLVRDVSAQGRRADATETSVDEKIYVRTFQYHYQNGQAVTTSSGADDNDPSSDNQHSHDIVNRTALGRELRRARHAPAGERIDLVEQEWDRLGRAVKLRRYLQPAVATAAITWQSDFDSLGRRLSLSEPGMSTRHSRYDEDGNEIASWWQNGGRQQVSRAKYDGFGRVVERQLSSINNSGVERVEARDRFHYDAHSGLPEQPASELRGRLSWAETMDVGSVFYGYDVLGRASSTSYMYRGHGRMVRESTQQTPGGRMTGLTLETSHGTDQIGYTYDSAERMRRVVRGNGTVLVDAQDVDAKGRYRRVVYGNGAVEGFDYAPFGREELLSWSAPGHQYEYLERDAAGRLTFERDTTATDSTAFAYEHDALGRLTTMAKSTGGLPTVEAYTHDPLGNLLTRSATTGIGDLVYQRDAADPDRMCRIAPPGSGSGCQFSYDGAGNVLVDNSGPVTRRFEYDPGQRIRRITRGNNEVTLRHGPVGRIQTEVRTPFGTRQAWHFGLVEERWSPGSVIHVERKIPGPLGVNVSLRTEIVGSGTPSHTTIYAHGDGRANRVFTGDNGAIVQSATYGTYGQTTTTASGAPVTQTDDLWNSGDNVPEVGLVLLGPRAYDPNLGRFLQRDPISVALRASSANPYAFAFSNPVDFADPSGLQGEASGGASVAGRVGVTVVFTAVGFLLGSDKRSPLNPRNAVGADGYTPSSLVRNVRSKQSLCGQACAAAREAMQIGSSAGGAYADYLLGKAEGVVDVVADLGELAVDSAVCGAKGVLCAVEKVQGGLRAANNVRVSAPALARALADDPLGIGKELLCGRDGCSPRDLGRMEVQVAAAIATPTATMKAVEAGEAIVTIGTRLAKALRDSRRVAFYHGTTPSAGARALGGLKPGVDGRVFLAEDFGTAAHFGREAAARRGLGGVTVMRFRVPARLAARLERDLIGAARDAPWLDLPGSTGYERILSGRILDEFNRGIVSGTIDVQRFKLGRRSW